jgi:hypothetical protein
LWHDSYVLVVLALAALAVLAGVVIVALGRGGQLTEFPPDVPPLDLPDAPQLSAVDFVALQLPVSLVGYHTQSVDDTLQRAAGAISARDTRIAVLEQRVAELLAARVHARQDAYAAPPSAPSLEHEPQGPPEPPELSDPVESPPEPPRAAESVAGTVSSAGTASVAGSAGATGAATATGAGAAGSGAQPSAVEDDRPEQEGADSGAAGPTGRDGRSLAAGRTGHRSTGGQRLAGSAEP